MQITVIFEGLLKYIIKNWAAKQRHTLYTNE